MGNLEAMGDQGVLARLADETQAVRWAAAVRALGPPWLLDVVQAYTTVAVFHDPALASVRDVLAVLASVATDDRSAVKGKLHVVPCCYALGPDLAAVAGYAGLSPEDAAQLHASVEYDVYAIGFCPGFPYMGYLPPALCGMPRLESPRLRVEPASVGLTGRQTGIYPEPRPGGWRLVGRTPLVLVDVAAGFFPLRTGDRVRFEPISEAEFRRLSGRRL